jgi:hypothetical protein
MAANGDDEALAEQELREAEEEAILEGPAPALRLYMQMMIIYQLAMAWGSQFR